MRDAIARGAVTGPRMLAAGTAFPIAGGHGDRNDLPPWVHLESDKQPGTAFGPCFCEQVGPQVKRHVDLIKTTASGGVLSYGDAFDVTAPESRRDSSGRRRCRFGRKVSAHCHGDCGMALAVAGGVHSIEHGTGVGSATLHAMQRRRTYLVPNDLGARFDFAAGEPESHPGR